MKQVVVAALLMSVYAASFGAALKTAATSAPFAQGWTNMFDPPFSQAPSIMMAISCLDNAECYVPAGSNNNGFVMAKWHGNARNNGNFEPLQMPKPMAMMMALAVGGTNGAPKGAVGGMGFEDGIQYFVNATTLMPSKGDPLFSPTQDMRASADGNTIMGVFSNGVYVSTNAGANVHYSPINTPMPLPNATAGRYGAVADASTYYVTLGSWPNNNNAKPDNKNRRTLSARVTVERDAASGRVRRLSKFVAPAVSNTTPGYSAVIAKTADGGKTWTNVYSSADNFYFNGIDCATPTHCIAVGEGFDDNAGGHVYMTTDGVHFEQVLFLPSSQNGGQYSLMAIKFVSPTEAFIAGSHMVSQFDTAGMFLHTVDGGKTWQRSPMLSFIGEITDMSFRNGVGFATAMTSFDDSTILRYDATGPMPTPAPTYNGPFTEISCADSACSVNCTKTSFPQNTCLKLQGGGSATAACQDGVLMQSVYPLTTGCTGPAEEQPIPVNQCLQNQDGSSFEAFCGPAPSSRAAMRSAKAALLRRRPAH